MAARSALVQCPALAQPRGKVGSTPGRPRVYPKMSAWGYLTCLPALRRYRPGDAVGRRWLARVGLSGPADMLLATIFAVACSTGLSGTSHASIGLNSFCRSEPTLGLRSDGASRRCARSCSKCGLKERRCSSRPHHLAADGENLRPRRLHEGWAARRGGHAGADAGPRVRSSHYDVR